MLRASAVVESQGIPTASLICDGFIGQAEAITPGLGVADLPIARVVGHVDGQSFNELQGNIEKITVDEVIKCLVEAPATGEKSKFYSAEEIVLSGSFDQVNTVFEREGWSDGLPINPPTKDRVNKFLKETPDDPERTIGVLQPSGFAATVRNVAINGVMANCHPKYMPILIGIVEILCDPNTV